MERTVVHVYETFVVLIIFYAVIIRKWTVNDAMFDKSHASSEL